MSFPPAASSVAGVPRFSAPAIANPHPDALARELEQLVTTSPDELSFQQAMVRLTASVTGCRAAFLYEADGGKLVAKIVVNADNSPEVFTAQQQIDLVAFAAVQRNAAQRATITQASGSLTLLCVPFSGSDALATALAVLMGPERAPFLEPLFALLQTMPQVFSRRQALTAAWGLSSGFEQSTLLIDLFSKVAQATEFRQGVSLVCEEFRELTGCARVAIGLGNQQRCKVYGLSGAGKIERAGHATSLLSGAMREAIGVSSAVSWPERADLPSVLASSSQSALLECSGTAEVITAPLWRALPGGKTETIGAWSFLWPAERRMTAEQFALIEAAIPHVGALIFLSSQSLPRGVRGAWRRFWAGASRMRKSLTLLFPFVFALIMLLPAPYRIGADCRLQPQRVRQIAAPFDGILEKALVKPGAPVQAGDLLAVLDGKEVRVRLAEAIARREAALKERDQAMAKGDIAAAQLAQLEGDGLGLEVELLQHRRDHLEIRAPIGGSVLSGNLERSEGVPVATGQKLFDIGPIDAFEVEILVPDSEVNHVAPGQKVQFRLESQARFRYESKIGEIHPISEIQEDQNVFVCLSTIANEDGRLRPGMRGKARIVTPMRPLGWIITHRLWDSLRLRFW